MFKNKSFIIFTPKVFKLLLFIKFSLLIVIILRLSDVIYFGDKPITAAEGEEPAAKDETKATPVEGKKDEAASTAPAPTKKNEYKTLLDELFDLPSFNGENLKKEEVNRYFTILEKKKKEIEERIQFIQNRQTSLADLEQVIDKKLSRLEEERQFFQDTVQKERDLKDKRLDNLVEFYGKMAPKKAAPVFESLNKDLVVELFNRLPQKQIMNILALMPPEKSVEISEYYGRVRSGKEYELLKELNNSLKDEFKECRELAAK